MIVVINIQVFKPTDQSMKMNKIFISFYYLVLLLFVSGCSLLDISEQMSLLNNVSSIQGTVVNHSEKSGVVHVLLLKRVEDHVEVVLDSIPGENGGYRFNVLPGSYMVGAFLDTDYSETYKKGDYATYLGEKNGKPDHINIGENSDVVIDTLYIVDSIGGGSRSRVRYSLDKANRNIGKVVPLEDAMFARENISMGFWQPFDYVEKFGAGLVQLQEFEEGKIPVIFIHGIFGTALDFEDVLSSIDRQKYQPWVLQYPSGLSLDMVSDYLVRALNRLHSRYDFPQVSIVAHSMGGLMIRSFVMKHQELKSPYKLSMVVTVNSPLYGMKSAEVGVNTSPIVVPAWRDVATGSDYIQRVHDWAWPKEIPYYLYFSYLPGESGDGVVPLVSQLSQSLQKEAVKIYGYQAGHASILRNKEFIQALNDVLDRI